MARITELEVNGTRRHLDADSDRTLLSVLRDDLDLTGAKYGCGEGQCAACTVLVDGTPTKSCLTKVGAVAGKRIVTIEGLAPSLTRPATGRQAAPGAGGVPRSRRHAVRLVHAGNDSGRGRSAGPLAQPHRRRNRRAA